MSRSPFFEKLLTRLDRLDREHVESYLFRLAQEKGFLETIFNSMLEGMVVTDRDQKVIFINHAAQDFLGARTEDLLHRDLCAYLEGLDLGELARLIRTDWGKLIHRDIEVVHPRPRVLHLNVFPLVGGEEALLGLVLLLSDVTRKKEEERDHLRSEKMETANLMAASLAHEIGNPLNSMDIYLQLMERELKRPRGSRKSLSEAVQVMKSQIRRLDHIVRSFLAAARPMRPNLAGANLNEVLDETIRLMHEEMARQKVTLKKSLDAKIPKMRFDEFQMKQAFSNIIKNALEAMPHGGLLKVSSFQEGDFARVCFEDNGEGIAKEALSKIFEPYFTTKASGSGLGLMISYRIVRDHGGRIEVESQPGRGTRLTVTLPLAMKRRMKLLSEHPHPHT